MTLAFCPVSRRLPLAASEKGEAALEQGQLSKKCLPPPLPCPWGWEL